MSTNSIQHGQGTVGTTRAVVAANVEGTDGIVIKALAANSGTVYVGGSGVTAANGYPLAAGEAIAVDIVGSGGIYVIGSAASQSYAYILAV